MNSDQLILFGRISTFSVIIPTLFGLYSKIYQNRNASSIFYLQCFSLIIELISFYFAYKNINNIVILNLYTFFEFFFIILFYKRFFDDFKPSSIHVALIAFFFFLVLTTSFFLNNIKIIDNLSISIEAIIIILYSLSFFYFVMKNLTYNDLLSTPYFWINIAFLIYFSGNLFLFVFSSYLQKHDQSSTYIHLYIIHSILNLLYYIIISIGFWKARKV